MPNDALMKQSDTLRLAPQGPFRLAAPVTTNKFLIGLLALLTVGFLSIVVSNLRESAAREGESAPPFEFKTDQGREVSATNFGGKVLVLNFWATWCPPCIREIPSLDAFQKQFKNQGVVVVAVSIDKNQQKYKAFLNRFGVDFDTYRDPSADISAEYGTFQIPESYIIKDGKVTRKLVNEQNWMGDDMVQYVKSLL
jgi:cytochrome c biogenesis protein CcmG/thiol:disulfide interchange protein DsbE